MNKIFHIYSPLTVEEKGVSKTKKGLRIAGYANTTDKDRAGDVITAAAWSKGIENYRKNPVLLYQHDHGKPIGRVEKVSVDKKGIFVEAYVSDAAENLHGVQTLIKDGALKSFSVGFMIKDGKYDRGSDTTLITDVELHEISVVSVPCNQESLFSVRKSFESNTEYEEFKKELMASEEIEEVEEKIEIKMEDVKEELVEEEDEVIESDPYKPIPFVNLLSIETANIENNNFAKYNNKRYKVIKIATAQNPIFQFLEVDLNGKSLDNTLTIPAENLSVVNFWDIGTNYDLEIISNDFKSLSDSDRSVIKDEFNSLINMTEQQLYLAKDSEVIKNSSLLQEKLNRTLNLLSVPATDWTDTNYHIANLMINTIKKLNVIDCNSEDNIRNLALLINGHKTIKDKKENEIMATENVGDPIVLETEKKVTETVEKTSDVSTIKVGDNNTEKLIDKAGEAVLKEAAAKSEAEARKAQEELAELKAQISKYKDEVKALTDSKNIYQANNTKSKFTEKQMANAYLLAKALNKRDPFDTKLGQQIKAVTSVDAFLSNFSTNIYEEMEQQLVIAPMFERLPVDAKTFRVPVANEDTADYVAQFESGTYATGVGDTTNVPTSAQHSIVSVDFTPHKFMVTTHLAKDEEEDTILPLIDFLRRAATRRLARSIDKAILRGTGALTGFTANPAGTSTYASVVKGIITMVNQVATDGLTVRTADGDTKATAANIASARAKMGKYGLQLGDHLVYLTSIEGYNELVASSDFRTVDKFGPNATYLTGSVGAIYGIPVVVTEFLDNVGSNSADIGALVYKPGWMIAERRGMEIESEYEPRQQVTAMYMSTRFDFKALSTVGSGANVSASYGFASTIRTLA